MDEPKVTTGLNQGRYAYPLADVSHLSPEEKMNVEKKVTATYERSLWYHRKRFNEKH